jgi:hypothetical protein
VVDVTETQTINPAEWTTVSEAARTIGVTPQRVSQMAADGHLDVIRPWPHIALVSLASLAAWQTGTRVRLDMATARSHVLATSGAATMSDVDPSTVLDALLEFVVGARPRWSLTRCVDWAEAMTSRLWRSATTNVPVAR